MTSGPLQVPDHTQRVLEGLGKIAQHGWLGLSYQAAMTLTRVRGDITTKITVKADLAKGFPAIPHYLSLLNTENEKIMCRHVLINHVDDDLGIFSVIFGCQSDDSPDGGWDTTFVYYLDSADKYHKARFFAEAQASDHIGRYLMTGILDGDPFP